MATAKRTQTVRAHSANCASCGKRFSIYRAGQAYCSPPCKRRAQNTRARGPVSTPRRAAGIISPRSASDVLNARPELSCGLAISNPQTMAADELSSFWTACNEVTHKLAHGKSDAVAFVMLVDNKGSADDGWYGRVGREFSFGPTSQQRAKLAVEAHLAGEPFHKIEGERSWRGDCDRIVHLLRPAQAA